MCRVEIFEAITLPDSPANEPFRRLLRRLEPSEKQDSRYGGSGMALFTQYRDKSHLGRASQPDKPGQPGSCYQALKDQSFFYVQEGGAGFQKSVVYQNFTPPPPQIIMITCENCNPPRRLQFLKFTSTPTPSTPSLFFHPWAMIS